MSSHTTPKFSRGHATRGTAPHSSSLQLAASRDAISRTMIDLMDTSAGMLQRPRSDHPAKRELPPYIFVLPGEVENTRAIEDSLCWGVARVQLIRSHTKDSRRPRGVEYDDGECYPLSDYGYMERVEVATSVFVDNLGALHTLVTVKPSLQMYSRPGSAASQGKCCTPTPRKESQQEKWFWDGDKGSNRMQYIVFVAVDHLILAHTLRQCGQPAPSHLHETAYVVAAHCFMTQSGKIQSVEGRMSQEEGGKKSHLSVSDSVLFNGGLEVALSDGTLSLIPHLQARIMSILNEANATTTTTTTTPWDALPPHAVVTHATSVDAVVAASSSSSVGASSRRGASHGESSGSADLSEHVGVGGRGSGKGSRKRLSGGKGHATPPVSTLEAVYVTSEPDTLDSPSLLEESGILDVHNTSMASLVSSSFNNTQAHSQIIPDLSSPTSHWEGGTARRQHDSSFSLLPPVGGDAPASPHPAFLMPGYTYTLMPPPPEGAGHSSSHSSGGAQVGVGATRGVDSNHHADMSAARGSVGESSFTPAVMRHVSRLGHVTGTIPHTSTLSAHVQRTGVFATLDAASPSSMREGVGGGAGAPTSPLIPMGQLPMTPAMFFNLPDGSPGRLLDAPANQKAVHASVSNTPTPHASGKVSVMQVVSMADEIEHTHTTRTCSLTLPLTLHPTSATTLAAGELTVVDCLVPEGATGSVGGVVRRGSVCEAPLPHLSVSTSVGDATALMQSPRPRLATAHTLTLTKTKRAGITASANGSSGGVAVGVDLLTTAARRERTFAATSPGPNVFVAPCEYGLIATFPASTFQPLLSRFLIHTTSGWYNMSAKAAQSVLEAHAVAVASELFARLMSGHWQDAAAAPTAAGAASDWSTACLSLCDAATGVVTPYATGPTAPRRAGAPALAPIAHRASPATTASLSQGSQPRKPKGANAAAAASNSSSGGSGSVAPASGGTRKVSASGAIPSSTSSSSTGGRPRSRSAGPGVTSHRVESHAALGEEEEGHVDSGSHTHTPAPSRTSARHTPGSGASGGRVYVGAMQWGDDGFMEHGVARRSAAAIPLSPLPTSVYLHRAHNTTKAGTGGTGTADSKFVGGVRVKGGPLPLPRTCTKSWELRLGREGDCCEGSEHLTTTGLCSPVAQLHSSRRSTSSRVRAGSATGRTLASLDDSVATVQSVASCGEEGGKLESSLLFESSLLDGELAYSDGEMGEGETATCQRADGEHRYVYGDGGGGGRGEWRSPNSQISHPCVSGGASSTSSSTSSASRRSSASRGPATVRLNNMGDGDDESDRAAPHNHADTLLHNGVNEEEEEGDAVESEVESEVENEVESEVEGCHTSPKRRAAHHSPSIRATGVSASLSDRLCVLADASGLLKSPLRPHSATRSHTHLSASAGWGTHTPRQPPLCSTSANLASPGSLIAAESLFALLHAGRHSLGRPLTFSDTPSVLGRRARHQSPLRAEREEDDGDGEGVVSCCEEGVDGSGARGGHLHSSAAGCGVDTLPSPPRAKRARSAEAE